MEQNNEYNPEEQQPPYLQEQDEGIAPEENSNEPSVPPGIMQPLVRPQSAEHSDVKGESTKVRNPREGLPSENIRPLQEAYYLV